MRPLRCSGATCNSLLRRPDEVEAPLVSASVSERLMVRGRPGRRMTALVIDMSSWRDLRKVRWIYEVAGFPPLFLQHFVTFSSLSQLSLASLRFLYSFSASSSLYQHPTAPIRLLQCLPAFSNLSPPSSTPSQILLVSPSVLFSFSQFLSDPNVSSATHKTRRATYR
ncbi:hypothetical protein E2C01_059302 [Portunus trituberculatus]|uniref:Uncharacterized protein n=1 Tax=Portunus trituberculatus TaxID=210409 RepID=A0A5B7GXM2_PORTR|nr:hypothetical protein [Portunus trituberculatus]